MQTSLAKWELTTLVKSDAGQPEPLASTGPRQHAHRLYILDASFGSEKTSMPRFCVVSVQYRSAKSSSFVQRRRPTVIPFVVRDHPVSPLNEEALQLPVS